MSSILSSNFSPKVLQAIYSRFPITNLLGCGAYACAWQIPDKRVLKLTVNSYCVEATLRRVEFTKNNDSSLDDILVLVDEVIKFKTKLTKNKLIEYYIIISELLTILFPATKLGIFTSINQYVWCHNSLPDEILADNYLLLAVALDQIHNFINKSKDQRNIWLSNINNIQYLVSLIEEKQPILRDVPNNILSIAFNKFRRLYEASLQLSKSLKDNGTPEVDLVRDAHGANWGLRNPNDLNSVVLFDLDPGLLDQVKLSKLELTQLKT